MATFLSCQGERNEDTTISAFALSRAWSDSLSDDGAGPFTTGSVTVTVQ